MSVSVSSSAAGGGDRGGDRGGEASQPAPAPARRALALWTELCAAAGGTGTGTGAAGAAGPTDDDVDALTAAVKAAADRHAMAPSLGPAVYALCRGSARAGGGAGGLYLFEMYAGPDAYDAQLRPEIRSALAPTLTVAARARQRVLGVSEAAGADAALVARTRHLAPAFTALQAGYVLHPTPDCVNDSEDDDDGPVLARLTLAARDEKGARAEMDAALRALAADALTVPGCVSFQVLDGGFEIVPRAGGGGGGGGGDADDDAWPTEVVCVCATNIQCADVLEDTHLRKLAALCAPGTRASLSVYGDFGAALRAAEKRWCAVEGLDVVLLPLAAGFALHPALVVGDADLAPPSAAGAGPGATAPLPFYMRYRSVGDPKALVFREARGSGADGGGARSGSNTLVVPLQDLMRKLAGRGPVATEFSAEASLSQIGRLRNLRDDIAVLNEFHSAMAARAAKVQMGETVPPVHTDDMLAHRVARVCDNLATFGYTLPSNFARVVVDGLPELCALIEEAWARIIQPARTSLAADGAVEYMGLQEYYHIGDVVVAPATTLGSAPVAYRVCDVYYDTVRSLLGGTKLSFHIAVECIVHLGDTYAFVSFDEIIGDWEGLQLVRNLPYQQATPEDIARFGERGAALGALGFAPAYRSYRPSCFFAHGQKKGSEVASQLASAGRLILDTARGLALGHTVGPGFEPVCLAIQATIKAYRTVQRSIAESAERRSERVKAAGLRLLDAVPRGLGFLCWPAVVGFGLSVKRWGHVLVDGLSSVPFNTDAWDRLVLPAAKKELLLSLVERSFDPTAPRLADLVANKGSGSLFLLHGAPGTGKCLGRDTPVLLSDGSVKLVQDVQVGDQLMGDDSTPRRVTSVATGRETMARVSLNKGDSFVCNMSHVLSLKCSGFARVCFRKDVNKWSATWRCAVRSGDVQPTVVRLDGKARLFEEKEQAEAHLIQLQQTGVDFCGTGQVVDIAVKDYLRLADRVRRKLCAYRVGFDFERVAVPMDPYAVGFWLGNRSSSSSSSSATPTISTGDREIVAYFEEFCAGIGLQFNRKSGTPCDYSITAGANFGPRDANAFSSFLREYNIWYDKAIPRVFKINDRATRLAVLAGVIDSGGSLDSNGYNLTLSSRRLIDDVVFVARSLGFAVTYEKPKTVPSMVSGTRKRTTKHGKAGESNGNKDGAYPRVHIADAANEIPCKLARKQARARPVGWKDALVESIEVRVLPEDDYFGFTLDGSHRFLLGSFIVTHNTLTVEALAERFGRPLYSLTFGELGASVAELESTMGEVLGLCSGWGALVLLDEGDALVERREKGALLLNCLTEEDQILTSEGFMFLDELEPRRADLLEGRLLIAGYHRPSEQLVYETPCGDLIVNDATPQTVIEFTQTKEAERWAAGSDAYGRTEVAGGGGKDEDHEDGGGSASDGPEKQSNYVSLVVTPGHDMFAREGTYYFGRSKPKAVWNKEKSVRIPSESGTKAMLLDFEKIRASSLHRTYRETLSPGVKRPAIQFLARAKAGILVPDVGKDLPFADKLGLGPEHVDPFLELYGFWLGDGLLTYERCDPRTGTWMGGYNSVAFTDTQSKPHGQAWLLATIRRLGLVEGVQYFSYTLIDPVDDREQHRIDVCDPKWFEYFHGQYGHRSAAGRALLTGASADGAMQTGPMPTRGFESRIVQGVPLSFRRRTYDDCDADGEAGAHSAPPPEAEDIKSAKWFWWWVWERLDKRQLRLIIAGLRRADGGGEAGNGNVIYTSSVRFRDELVQLFLHAGYTASFRVGDVQGDGCGLDRKGHTIDCWEVRYADKFHSKPALRDPGEVKEVPYAGRTWCATMPSGFLIARRARRKDGVVTCASRPIVVGNSMVGVLLKSLDAFEGLLFITTNRVASFDPAALSRVTLAVRYGSLKAEGRRRVWTNVLERAGTRPADFDCAALAARGGSGRDINAAARLALALAHHRKTRLCQALFIEVLDIMDDFKKDFAGGLAPLSDGGRISDED